MSAGASNPQEARGPERRFDAGTPQWQGGPSEGYPSGMGLPTAPVSARLVNAPELGSGRLPGPSADQTSVASMTGVSVGSTGGPVLRKKLFDQNVSDWASRYRKHKQSLDQCTRDCELLRTEVVKYQAEVDERAQKTAELEDRFQSQTVVKFADIKSSVEVAAQRKQQLALEVGEARKLKAQLAKECKLLKADYERKHSELARGAEMRDKLEQQLVMYTQQLNQVSSERQRLEKELELVQHNLRQHTELADEVHGEIERTCGGMKTSVQHHMGSLRLQENLEEDE
mmetsp:Transcript_23646/g.44669  ORF Transcript_23646/g.44669 Transcript_23646/m.44669 type:complete len:285 (+) Transcript_23646:86-940(+)